MKNLAFNIYKADSVPIIPVQMNGDNIEGITDYLDWYTYCD